MNELAQSIRARGNCAGPKCGLSETLPLPRCMAWTGDGSYEHYNQDSGYTEGIP